MARPTKETVDYFPHFVKCGRTIFILESKYGNDGYAFWFKLLEILGDAEGHYYDCSIPNNWAYLLAKTRCDEDTAKAIIGTLLTLDKIDGKLWNDRQVIWCQHFVDNVSSVYKMRHADTPTPPSFSNEKPQGARVSNNENHKMSELIHKETDIVEESREKKRIYPYQDIVALWNSTCKTLPSVTKLSDNRRTKIKCRLDEFGKQEAWMPTVEALFEKIAASDFLRGDNNSNWTASFDWLFDNSKNWVKVSEGNYDNKRGAKSAPVSGANNLGVGEYIDNTGKRTYGTGKANIPMSAPPRPSDGYTWNESSKTWIML